MRRDILGRATVGVTATIEQLRKRMQERLDVGAGKMALTPKELERSVGKLSDDEREMFINNYPGGVDKYLDDIDGS